MTLDLYGLPPQNASPPSDLEKNINVPSEELSTKRLTSTQHCQGNQKQGKLEKFSEPKGA